MSVWRQHAQRFLGHYRGFSCNPCTSFVRRRFARVQALLSPPPTGLVLDIGCGNGYYLSCLPAAPAPRIGLDYSLSMLHAAAEPVTFSRINASACAMPFRPAAADVLLLIGVANYIPAISQVLSECRRALRPAGRILLTFPTGATLLSRLRAIHCMQRLREAWFGLAPVVNYADTPAALDCLLRRHGFTLQHCEVLRIAGFFASAFLCLATVNSDPVVAPSLRTEQ